MTKEEFYNISEVKVIQGFRIIHLNAKKLFESAELLSISGHYAQATSLIILSSEEAVKALALVTKIISPNVSIEIGIDKFFKDHSHKHLFAQSGIEQISIIVQKILEIYLEAGTNLFYENQIDKHRMDSIKSTIKEKQDKLFFLKTAEVSEWWDKANELKMSGFYVSYKDNKWRSPSISEEEYFQSFEIISSIFIILEMLSNILNEKDR